MESFVTGKHDVAGGLHDQAANLPRIGNRLRKCPTADVLQPIVLEPCPGEDPPAVFMGSDENNAVAAPPEETGGWAGSRLQGNRVNGRFSHTGSFRGVQVTNNHS